MGTDGFAARDGKGGRSTARAPVQPGRRQVTRPARRGEARPDPRLEALHRQTGVLAHDFNNLLNVILAANEALAAQLPENSDGYELARISQEAAEKGAALLARLVDLSRPETSAGDVDDVVDAAEVAVTTARLAQVSTAASVTVVALAMAEPLACHADRGGLEQALLNLCVNAGHAMPGGGAVQIAVSSAMLDDGAHVAFSVIDSGVGMSPEILARASEPYFTTRAGRGGAGLGLSGVADFARRSGGTLKLVSREGRGTTVTLYLPRA